MLITAGTKLAGKVRCTDLRGDILGNVSAADTDEGWIEMYLLRPNADKNGHNRIFRDGKKRELAKVRLHTDFDIVTRRGRKLFSVRWAWSGPARVKTTKHGPLPK